MKKQDLRRSMKALRVSVTDPSEKSKQICERILQCKSYQTCQTLLVYLAIGSEVSLEFLIQQAQKDGKTVAVPRILGPRRMEFRVYDPDHLEEGDFHTVQPTLDCALPSITDADTLLIAPGLAFSPDGRRLGYGGGFYDTFLNTNEITVYGAAFDEQIVPEIPSEEHDHLIDKLITPGGIYDCLRTRNPETN